MYGGGVNSPYIYLETPQENRTVKYTIRANPLACNILYSYPVYIYLQVFVSYLLQLIITSLEKKMLLKDESFAAGCASLIVC